MIARKPLPVDLINALLADYKKPEDLFVKVKAFSGNSSRPSSDAPSMPK